MSGERPPKDARHLINELRHISDLYRQRQFPTVLAESRQLLTHYPGVIPLLLFKALSIAQLDDADSRLAPWGEEKESLLLAAEIDPLSTSALIELGSYLFASEGDSEGALTLFQKSIALNKARLRRGYIGAIRCLIDIADSNDTDADRVADGRRTAKTLLDEATRLFPVDSELEDIRDYHKLY